MEYLLSFPYREEIEAIVAKYSYKLHPWNGYRISYVKPWTETDDFERYERVMDLLQFGIRLKCNTAELVIDTYRVNDIGIRQPILELIETKISQLLRVTNHTTLEKHINAKFAPYIKEKDAWDSERTEIEIARDFLTYLVEKKIEKEYHVTSVEEIEKDSLMDDIDECIREILDEKDIFHNHTPSNPDFEAYQLHLAENIHPLNNALYKMCMDILINENISYSDIKKNRLQERIEEQVKVTFAERGNQKMMNDYLTFILTHKCSEDTPEYANFNKLRSLLTTFNFPKSNSISKRMAAQYIHYVLTDKLIAPQGRIKSTEAAIIYDLLELFGYNKDSNSSSSYNNKDKYDRIKSYFKIDKNTGQYIAVF